MNKKFIGLVEYTLSKAKINTKGMNQEEKIAKFNELEKNKLTKQEKKTTMKKYTNLTPKAGYIMLPPAEYAQFCSALTSQYGSNIPPRGSKLLGNYYYLYKYTKRNYKIVCTQKLHIERDAVEINEWEERLNGKGKNRF